MELMISEIRELIGAPTTNRGTDFCRGPWKIGQAYMIRTATHYHTGRLVAVYEKELVLESAAWIADTGRFSDCLKTGVLNEVEPMPGPVFVGRLAVVDAAEWPHPLPTEQK